MELFPPSLPAFKYRRGTPTTLSRGRKLAAVLLALFGLGGLYVWPPAGTFLLLVAAALPLVRAKNLLLGPRYLLCGDALIYYANVVRAEVSLADGWLRLQTASGKTLTIERKQFPTNARKADKIVRNQAAKFEKVAAKIIDKVRDAAPGAEVTGY